MTENLSHPTEKIVKTTGVHRDINTYMKRKTHVGKRAELGLTEACWHFFIQSPTEFETMNISQISDLHQYFATQTPL